MQTVFPLVGESNLDVKGIVQLGQAARKVDLSVERANRTQKAQILINNLTANTPAPDHVCLGYVTPHMYFVFGISFDPEDFVALGPIYKQTAVTLTATATPYVELMVASASLETWFNLVVANKETDHAVCWVFNQIEQYLRINHDAVFKHYTKKDNGGGTWLLHRR